MQATLRQQFLLALRKPRRTLQRLPQGGHAHRLGQKIKSPGMYRLAADGSFALAGQHNGMQQGPLPHQLGQQAQSLRQDGRALAAAPCPRWLRRQYSWYFALLF